MKFLGTLKDTLLNKEYDLYEMNARVLENLLKKTNKMSKVKLQTFNWEIQLPQYINELQEILDGKHNNNFNNADSRLRKKILEEIQKIKDNTYIKDSEKAIKELGYELMPIIVEVKGRDITNSNCEVKLIDGFRRMFYVDEVPDRTILVKVYDELNDKEWINAMVIFNSWKFVHNKSVWNSYNAISQKIIDRGFNLGLYLRYGIDFIKLTSYTHQDIWHLINIYIKDNYAYETLWNNNQFHKDILVLNKIENYKPVFKFVKGKKKIQEIVFDNNEIKYGQLTSMEKLAICYINILGRIRREEYKREQQGIEVVRKEFNVSDYYMFLEREDLQEHFIKLMEMKIPGTIDNYINKYISKEMIKYLYKIYLDIDWEPEEKQKISVSNYDITEIKL